MLGMFEKIKRKDDHLDKLQHVMICTVLTQAQQWACEHKSELILQYQSCIFTHHSAVANNDLQWKKRTIAIWQFFCDYTNIFSLVLFFFGFFKETRNPSWVLQSSLFPFSAFNRNSEKHWSIFMENAGGVFCKPFR